MSNGHFRIDPRKRLVRRGMLTCTHPSREDFLSGGDNGRLLQCVCVFIVILALRACPEAERMLYSELRFPTLIGRNAGRRDPRSHLCHTCIDPWLIESSKSACSSCSPCTYHTCSSCPSTFVVFVESTFAPGRITQWVRASSSSSRGISGKAPWKSMKLTSASGFR
jgi:hypothetical protein